jgi:protein phosphatase PTC7
VQGDSGFIVVRNGEIAMRSSPKQHFFDCPLQFGAYPEFVDGTDTADDAEVFHLPVQPGDIVVAGAASSSSASSSFTVLARL